MSLPLRTEQSLRCFFSALHTLQDAQVGHYLLVLNTFHFSVEILLSLIRQSRFSLHSPWSWSTQACKHSFLPLLLFQHSLGQLRLVEKKNSDFSWHSRALPVALIQAVYYALIILIQSWCGLHLIPITNTSWAKKRERGKTTFPRYFSQLISSVISNATTFPGAVKCGNKLFNL